MWIQIYFYFLISTFHEKAIALEKLPRLKLWCYIISDPQNNPHMWKLILVKFFIVNPNIFLLFNFEFYFLISTSHEKAIALEKLPRLKLWCYIISDPQNNPHMWKLILVKFFIVNPNIFLLFNFDLPWKSYSLGKITKAKTLVLHNFWPTK